MGRIRKITRNPIRFNYFLIDTNVLVNKYLKPGRAGKPDEKARIEACQAWWLEISSQIKRKKAKIFLPDVCIAEAFKTLAKKHYSENFFGSAAEYNNTRNRLSKDIRITSATLRGTNRYIAWHDISTSRDLIISVDRFFEFFNKKALNVQIADLLVAATAKYVLDFYDIPKDSLHIVTMDSALYKGIKQITDLPRPYNPAVDPAHKIFE